MKVLVADDEEELRELLTFMIESTFHASVVQVSSASEAVRAIQDHPDLTCVVCDYSLKNGTGEDVFRHLLSSASKVPFILCSSYHPSKFAIFTGNSIYGSVLKPMIYEGLKDLLQGLLNIRDSQASGGFSRLRAAVALKFGIFGSDIYIKVGQDKFIKIFHKGAPIEATDLEKFKAKGIEFLYIENSGARAALKEIILNISHLSKVKTADIGPSMDMSRDALEAIASFNATLGFTKEANILTQECIKLTLKTIQANSTLGVLFSRLRTQSESYFSFHSVALAHLACGLASLLGWTSEVTFYKLSLAAFLHDITLPNDKIAQIQSLQELSLRRGQFSEEEMTIFRKHPEAAADIIASLADIPPDIDSIVRQHHELPDGSGFPRCLEYAQLTPLSCLIIMAHKLLPFLCREEGRDAILSFLGQLDPSFERGNFGKITNAIKLSVAKQV